MQDTVICCHEPLRLGDLAVAEDKTVSEGRGRLLPPECRVPKVGQATALPPRGSQPHGGNRWVELTSWQGNPVICDHTAQPGGRHAK